MGQKGYLLLETRYYWYYFLLMTLYLQQILGDLGIIRPASFVSVLTHVFLHFEKYWSYTVSNFCLPHDAASSKLNVVLCAATQLFNNIRIFYRVEDDKRSTQWPCFSLSYATLSTTRMDLSQSMPYRFVLLISLR